ncbi:hypothetical protein, partial [[Eubacterium] cellulosolvens]
SLREPLRNMTKDIEEFRLTEAGDIGKQQLSSSAKSGESEWIRVMRRYLQKDTQVTLVLQDGESVEGRVAELAENSLYLLVKYDRRPGFSINKEFKIDSIESWESHGSEKWMSSKKAREIPTGKKIEVLLLTGEKLRGHLSYATFQGFGLRAGKETTRELAFTDVAAVRKLGTSTAAKIVLAGAIAFAALMAISYAALYYSGG